MEEQSKREILTYRIAKNLYAKAKESVHYDNKDVLLHPSDWINNKSSMISSWKEYLNTTDYTLDDPFSIYMNFMYKNYYLSNQMDK